MRQCPKCELRFRSDGELADHLVRDHGVEPDTLPTLPQRRPVHGRHRQASTTS